MAIGFPIPQNDRENNRERSPGVRNASWEEDALEIEVAAFFMQNTGRPAPICRLLIRRCPVRDGSLAGAQPEWRPSSFANLPSYMDIYSPRKPCSST